MNRNYWNGMWVCQRRSKPKVSPTKRLEMDNSTWNLIKNKSRWTQINIRNDEGDGPRWQHRQLLNFSPPRDTLNTKLHMEKFPLREIQKPAEWLQHLRLIRKYPYKTWQEWLRYILAINPISGTVPNNWEGNPSSQLCPEVLGCTSNVPAFKPPTQGTSPQNT